MTRQDSQLAVRWSVNGVEEVRSLDVLRSTIGGGSDSRLSGTTDMADWVEVPTQVWITGVGLPGIACDHRVWSVRIGEFEAVIPAHALFQSLLRPGKYVLQEIFRPQSIDGICTMIDGVPMPTVSWPDARTSADSVSFRGPMTWLHCFPSARRMASSIYDLAGAGVLGCELAQGRLTAVLHGTRKDDCLYVTKLTITAISTSESPFPFAEGLSGEICTFKANERMAKANSLPLRADEYRLSDEEWMLLGHLLPWRENRVHPARDLVDAMLRRLCQVAGRSDVDRAVARAASSAHIRWTRNGHWAAFESQLCSLRGGRAAPRRTGRRRAWTTKPPVERKPKPETGLCLEHYGPLDDAEWAKVESLLFTQNFLQGQSSNRAVFDKMLECLGAGNRWGKRKKSGHTLERAAEHRYIMFVRAGRWPTIADRLNLIRPKKSAS